MPLTYRNAAIGGTGTVDPALVRMLQRDLRALGYLERGIDGRWGDRTRLAVRRLQFDLLHNDGNSGGNDGPAPVAITGYNRGVSAVSGIVDTALADSIEALLDEGRIPALPRCTDPAQANRAAAGLIAKSQSSVAPAPYLLALFTVENGGEHFAQPRDGADTDTFLAVGFDGASGSADQVISRFYGLGQHALFHHPPRPDEVTDILLDPLRNAQQAFAGLRGTFDHFVAGADPATRAEERDAEHPLLALRICRYGPGDPRYLSACGDCARQAGKLDIERGTPLHRGSAQTYGDPAHAWSPGFVGVPDRADFQCDWPYAVRRYHGDGPASFNLQARVLLNLLDGRNVEGTVR